MDKLEREREASRRRQQLILQGQKLAELQAQTDAAKADLKRAVLAAIEYGVPGTEIAELAGVTKITVYAWRDKHQAQPATPGPPGIR